MLNDPQLFSEWKDDIKGMSDRIISMRKKLFHLLTNVLQTPEVGEKGKGWTHITSQIGMFSFTGLNRSFDFILLLSRAKPRKLTKLHCSPLAVQCKALVERGHVYLTGNGRISMAGLNESNIDYFAKSLDAAVRGTL
jgi:aspartate aminotransferase